MQLIEEKYRFRFPNTESKGAGSLDPDNDAALFLGLGSASLGGRFSVGVMPSLAEYIGEEMAKEAAVAKGKVKAFELREKMKALRNPNPNPKKLPKGPHVVEE